MSEENVYRVSSSWNPGAQAGQLVSGSRTLSAPFGGAASLGGRADLTNPEELLLAALEACFVQTWAIFLAKLKVPIDRPILEGSLKLDKDPAGGFRVARIDLVPNIPRALWEQRKGDIGKTLELAEKYCIVSRALRAGPSLLVTPKLVD
ncbi:MAG: OsmC family protein [Acidithiobacillales bacterium]